MFLYAAPLSAAVDGPTNNPLAFELMSNTMQLNQAVPSLVNVTVGSLAAS